MASSVTTPFANQFRTGVPFATEQSRLLATAGADKTIRLWEVTRTGQPTAIGPPITGHSATVQAVRFTGGSTLLSAGQDGSLMLWDLHDPPYARQQAAMFSSTTLTGLSTLAVGPDGHTVAVGTANATVVGDVDPDQVAHLICATDSAPMAAQEWEHYLPDTARQQLCP